MAHNLGEMLDRLKSKGIYTSNVEKELKIGNGYLGKIRKGYRVMTSDVLKKLLPFYEKKIGSPFEWKEWDEVDIDEPAQKCMPIEEWESFQEKLKVAENKPSVSKVLSELEQELKRVNEETIPKERNTSLGKTVWERERQTKIRDLKGAIQLLSIKIN